MEVEVDQVLQQAVAAHNSGNLEEAKRLYKSILITQPTHPHAIHNLGLIELSKGKVESALQLFKAALEENSSVDQFWISYIDTLISEQQFENAKQAITNGERKGVAKKILNALEQKLMSVKEGGVSIKEPSEVEIQKLINYYENAQYDDAETLAISISEQFPNHQFSWKVLGAILKQTGKLSESLVASQKSVQLAPQDVEAHSNLGVTLQEIGRLEDAEASYREAIRLKPDYAEAHSNLGITLEGSGRFKDAEASYREAIRLKPDYAEAHYNLGVTLNKLSRFDEAIESTKKSLVINPGNISAQINLSEYKGSSVPNWHLSMMNDLPRNKAYFDAIKLAINENDLVLDIGTGSGILSMMAIDAGAKKVITCESSSSISEIAKKIIHKNGYSKTINVIKKKSTDLIIGKDLPRKADVVISEILSAEFVGEGVCSSILDANNRLLAENGRMIPESGSIMIALLGENTEITNEVRVGNINGFDLSKFNSVTSNRFTLRLNEKPKFLSNAEVAFKLNLYDLQKTSNKELILTLIAKEGGICIGVIQWMKIQLFNDIEHENKPGQTKSHWPTPVYRFDNPVELIAGQELKIKATLGEDAIWFSHFE